MPSLSIRRLACHGLATVIHAAILTWPVWLTASKESLGLSWFVFILGVIAAAAFEGSAVSPSDIVMPQRDQRAISVARFVGASMLAVFWLAQWEHAIHPLPANVFTVGGMMLVAMGILLRVIAIRTLGSGFNSDITLNSTPIVHGIYAVMKHPSEVGLLLIVIGAPLILGAWRVTLLAMTIFLPVSFWRMRRENQYHVQYLNKLTEACDPCHLPKTT